jgi:outer membrane receptor protein involved in Fe transport
MTRTLWTTGYLLGMCVTSVRAPAQPPTGTLVVQLADRGPLFYVGTEWNRSRDDVRKTSIFRKRVSVHLEHVPLAQALTAIAQQAALSFGYPEDTTTAKTRVSLDANGITVASALNELLLDTGLDVSVGTADFIGLVPHSGPAARSGNRAPEGGTVSGRVTDAETKRPVPDAVVLLEHTTYGATTADSGTYRIAHVAPGTYTVFVRRLGYRAARSAITVVTSTTVEANFVLSKSPRQLDQVVVTSTLVPTEVKALPTPISIIGDSEIAAQQPRTVQELFRQVVPGAVSWDFAARPEESDFSVRGASTLTPGNSQMKVFIDGVEIVEPTYAAIDPTSIARIEVIRGPQAAAVYGSDAIGGVIAIFTKHGDASDRGPHFEARASAGDAQTKYPGFRDVLRQAYDVSATGGGIDMGYHVGAGYSSLANWVPGGQESKQSNPRISGGVHVQKDFVNAELTGRYSVQNNPDVFDPAFMQTGFVDYSKPMYAGVQFANVTLGAHAVVTPTSWWQHTLTVGIDQLNNDYVQYRPRLTTPSDTLLTITNTMNVKRSVAYNTSIQGTWGTALTGQLSVGVDHWSYPLTSYSGQGVTTAGGIITPGPGGLIVGTRTLTNNTGEFVQGQVGLYDRLFVTVGARAEQNTSFGDSIGSPISPRVGLSYVQPLGAATLKLRGAWGSALRAPDPSAKLTIPPYQVGNPRLGPERQRGWDGGVDAEFGSHGSISVSVYDQVAINLIQQISVPNESLAVSQSQNVGRVLNTGIEFEAALTLGALRLHGQYAYSRARIEELAAGYSGDLRVGDQVLMTPIQTGGIVSGLTLHTGTTLSAGLSYVGRYHQYNYVPFLRCLVAQTAPTCPPSYLSSGGADSRAFIFAWPGFIKLNTSVTQRVAPWLDVFVSGDNVTNDSSMEAVSFPVMGRITTFGITMRY